jgi:hypothetical protein
MIVVLLNLINYYLIFYVSFSRTTRRVGAILGLIQ